MRYLLPLFITLVSCCTTNSRVAPVTPPPLAGEFTKDGSTSNLNKYTKKPLVVMLSAYECPDCTKNTTMVAKYILKYGDGSIPTNVDIITLIIDDDPDGLSPDWLLREIFGYQDDDFTLRTFCREPYVPCTLISIPSKGITFHKNGLVSMREILEHTGEWKYESN